MATIPDLGKIFGKGSPAEQLLVWAVLSQVISAVGAPAFELLEQDVRRVAQTTPLSPAVLADMVVRNILPEDQAAEVAKRSGLAPSDFHQLVLDTGDAPPTQLLLEAFRRGVITWSGEGGELPSAVRGLLQGRLRDEWIPLIFAMATVPIPVAEAVDAVVEGQIDYAQGEQIAYQNGIDKDGFRVLVNTRGNPPSPMELVTLYRKGLIPLEGVGPDQTSVQQGIFEGATKDKWWRLIAALADYIPPPRTVTALVREGSLSDEEALHLYHLGGLSEQLAGAYLHSAHHQKTAAEKDLAKADLLQMYEDRVITASETGQGLQLMGYSAGDVAWLLAWRDARRTLRVLNTSISRIHTLYVNRRIDATEVTNALNRLKVPADQQQLLLGDWGVERDSSVKVLTAAEIASAYFYKVIDESTAMTKLQADGYSAVDAWILLSVRQHGPQPNPPAGVVVPPRG